MEKHPYRVIRESGPPERLAEVLADDVTFHSTVLAKPVVGRDLVLQIMIDSGQAQQFSCVNEFRRDDETILIWSGTIAGHPLQMFDLIRDDAQGRIEEYTSTIRPYPAVARLRRAMYDRLRSVLPPDVWDLPARAAADAAAIEAHSVAVATEAHVAIPSDDPFEDVVQRLEAAIGGPRFGPFESIVSGSTDWDDFRRKIEARLGPSGFMKFLVIDHGPWMALDGVRLKSRQYVIGNPLIARNVVPHDPAAGLYVPMRVGVYEDKRGTAWLEYDRPSASLGLSHDPRIDEVGRLLDDKLARLAEMATTGR